MRIEFSGRERESWWIFLKIPVFFSKKKKKRNEKYLIILAK